MTNSFYNGVSGIKTQNVGVDIVANNIANVNTVGFKRTSSEFADIFYRRVASQSTNPTESGGGSTLSASKVVYEQGSFEDGENEFDVALSGKGFFGVMGYNQTYYTRNGEFVRDANGYLVDSAGNYVLGTMNPNFTSITYSQRVAEEMGRINGTVVNSGYTVSNPNESFSIVRGAPQSALFVPRNLYYFPEVTTAVSFKGTLSSQKTWIDVNLFAANANEKVKINKKDGEEKTYTLSLDLSTDDVYSAAVGDKISIVVKDKNDKEYTITGELSAKLNADGTTSNTQFSFTGDFVLDSDDFDPNNAVSSVSLKTQQDFADSRNFGARIYNSDGSVSLLRYTLDVVTPRTEGNIVFNVQARFYDEANNAISEVSTGTMTFNKNGALIANTLTSVPNPYGGTVSVSFGTPTNTPATNGIGAGWDGVYLKFDSNDADAIDYTANGSAEGFFSQYQIGTDGSLNAQFTNGKVVTVGKLALYNFINEQGLASLGSNNFIATSNSGAASFLYDSQGNYIYTANFVGKKRELSNTDLSTELTNLIVMQRAFEASSKSITTSDDMIETAIGLKR